ncbi:MAG: phytoene/squalene synthase family protein [Bacteroidales bacterium]|nr:phytoene/squalene synthase family protein [Bacteroidales bacterium]
MTSLSLFDHTAFEVSELVTKNYSTSFYKASRLFDKETRQGIFAIYGFVRFADEIVDTFDIDDQESLLKKFETDYLNAQHQGISLNPLLQSFQIAVNKYQIPYDLIEEFLNSMKQDLRKKQYGSKKEMDAYIYGSADVVGLMCLKVFSNGNEALYNELKQPAQKLGSAFQKVNFLRDLKNDLQILDRSYFPGVNSHTFDNKAKQKITEEIRLDFQEALKGIRKLPQNARLAVYVAYKYYSGLLRKIERTDAQLILRDRIRISNGYKSLLLGLAYVENKLNLLQ